MTSDLLLALNDITTCSDQTETTALERLSTSTAKGTRSSIEFALAVVNQSNHLLTKHALAIRHQVESSNTQSVERITRVTLAAFQYLHTHRTQAGFNVLTLEKTLSNYTIACTNAHLGPRVWDALGVLRTMLLEHARTHTNGVGTGTQGTNGSTRSVRKPASRAKKDTSVEQTKSKGRPTAKQAANATGRPAVAATLARGMHRLSINATDNKSERVGPTRFPIEHCKDGLAFNILVATLLCNILRVLAQAPDIARAHISELALRPHSALDWCLRVQAADAQAIDPLLSACFRAYYTLGSISTQHSLDIRFLSICAYSQTTSCDLRELLKYSSRAAARIEPATSDKDQASWQSVNKFYSQVWDSVRVRMESAAVSPEVVEFSHQWAQARRRAGDLCGSLTACRLKVSASAVTKLVSSILAIGCCVQSMVDSSTIHADAELMSGELPSLVSAALDKGARHTLAEWNALALCADISRKTAKSAQTELSSINAPRVCDSVSQALVSLLEASSAIYEAYVVRGAAAKAEGSGGTSVSTLRNHGAEVRVLLIQITLQYRDSDASALEAVEEHSKWLLAACAAKTCNADYLRNHSAVFFNRGASLYQLKLYARAAQATEMAITSLVQWTELAQPGTAGKVVEQVCKRFEVAALAYQSDRAFVQASATYARAVEWIIGHCGEISKAVVCPNAGPRPPGSSTSEQAPHVTWILQFVDRYVRMCAGRLAVDPSEPACLVSLQSQMSIDMVISGWLYEAEAWSWRPFTALASSPSTTSAVRARAAHLQTAAHAYESCAPVAYARCVVELAKIARDQGDHTCEDHLHAAMEVAKSQKDSVYVMGVLAECYAWQAVVRIEAGGLEADAGSAEVQACTQVWALMHSLDMDTHVEDSGYFSTVVGLMQQVAELLQSRRRFTQAADILRVAVDMATRCELSDPSWAPCTMECMASLALSHMHEGNATTAIQHMRNAVSRYETGVLPVTVEIASLASFALCELATGDTNAGARTLQSAETLARTSWDAVAKQRHATRRPKADANTLVLLATTSHVYAKLALKQGMLADAIDFGVHAYRVLNSLLSSMSMARKRMARNIDDDPFSDKDNADKEDTKDDIVFAGNWQLQRLLLDVLVHLTEMYAVRGSTKEADYFLQKAMDVARMLRAPLPTAHVQVVETDVMSRKSIQGSCVLRENVAGASVGDTVHALLVEGDSLRRCGDYEGAHKAYARAIHVVEGGEDVREPLLDATPRLQRILGQSGLHKVVTSDTETTVPEVVREDIAIRQQLTTLLSVLADDNANEGADDVVNKMESVAGRSMDQQPTHQLLQCSVAFADLQQQLSLDPAFEPILRSSLMFPSLRVARTQRPRKGTQGARVRDQLLALNTQLIETIRCAVSVGSSHAVHEASHMLVLARAMLTAFGFAQLLGVERIVDDCRNVTVAREVVDARRRRDREPVALGVWPEDILQGAELRGSEVNSPTASPVLRARGSSAAPVLGGLTLDSDDLESDLGEEFQRAVDGDHVVRMWETEPTDSLSSELPPSWIVCGLSIDQARNMLIVTRYAHDHEPLTLCLPMRHVCASEHVSIDTHESRSVFDDAHNKLRAIIRESDRTMKTGAACATEREKRAWWEHRASLDKQMGALVESVEDEWLGAFRHMLDPLARVSAPDVRELCARVEKCMVACLSKPFATKARAMELAPELCLAVQCVAQRRSATHADSDWLDVCALVWDVYFFQGAAPAGSDEMLTEFADRLSIAMAEVVDAETEQVDAETEQVDRGPMHVVLVLDKHAQQIPWESLPTLRKYSASRVPSLAFLRSRMATMRSHKPMSALSPNLMVPLGKTPALAPNVYGGCVDGSHLFYVLNPEGDLMRTQAGFEEFVRGGPSTWHGCVGRRPTHAEIEHGLQTGVFVYFGHGGAEAYVARSYVRAQKCTVALLMGCSSGRLEWAGEFDALGTATDYMVGGSMAVVGNLWDVGDKDIDRFAACVVGEWGLNEYSTGEVKIKQDVDQARGRVSLAEAVCNARSACRMKYLTGAAPVVYGIPVYLR
ncbi:separin protein [Coemansia sp. RSA 2131]|nr:separin protein [Coemansia sp. RSA 2131]